MRNSSGIPLKAQSTPSTKVGMIHINQYFNQVVNANKPNVTQARQLVTENKNPLPTTITNLHGRLLKYLQKPNKTENMHAN